MAHQTGERNGGGNAQGNRDGDGGAAGADAGGSGRLGESGTHAGLVAASNVCGLWGELALSGGSIHVRNELHSDVIYMNFGEGYVAVGENAILFDYDVSLNTMNGRGGGQFDVALGFLPAPAGFSGHFNGHIGPDGLRARAVGQGSGVFDGDWLKATIEQFQPTSEQLEWMCGGEMVYKAVAVTATIIDK